MGCFCFKKQTWTQVKQQIKTYQDQLIRLDDNMYFLLWRGCRLTREKLLGQAGWNEADQCRPTDPQQPSILAHTLPTLPLPVCTTSSCYCTPPMSRIMVYIYIKVLLISKPNLKLSHCSLREWNSSWLVLYCSPCWQKSLIQSIIHTQCPIGLKYQKTNGLRSVCLMLI